MKSNSTFFYHFAAFATAAIWGSTFVFTKMLLLNGLSPAQIFTLRFIIAYVLLMLFSCFRQGNRWLSDNWRDELLFVVLGATGGSLYFLTENEAMNYTTTTNTSLIVCSCPLFTSLLVGFFYKSERLNRSQVFGMLLALAGLVLVVMNGQFVLHLSPVGDALAFAACICWAVYSLVMKSVNQKYDAVFITRKVFFYGLVTIIPYYMLYPGLPAMEVLLRPAVFGNLLFLGAVASLLCFVIWTLVMDKLGVVVATNYVFINPVSTIFFAWWLLSEPITLYFLIGTALILGGMYLCDRKLKQS